MKYLKEIRSRLTAEEKVALKIIAQENDMSQSAFMRQLLHMAIKKHGELSSPHSKPVKT